MESGVSELTDDLIVETLLVGSRVVDPRGLNLELELALLVNEEADSATELLLLLGLLLLTITLELLGLVGLFGL